MRKGKRKNKLSPVIIALLLTTAVIVTTVFILVLDLGSSSSTGNTLEAGYIRNICELATLECYYHNVCEWQHAANAIGFGEKKLWIEYDGTIKVGVKADQLSISGPDANNVFTVTMPLPTILDKDLVEDSIYEIDSESPMLGFLPIYNSVSAEDRRDAITKAQADMGESAAKNGMIMAEALNRAKLIIRKYITESGEKIGKTYDVRFVMLGDASSSTAESGQYTERY